MTKNHFQLLFTPFQINRQLYFIFIFSQNVWPFWMTENHSWSHFSPFQNNTELFLFEIIHKMAAGHIGLRRSLSIDFLAISDQYVIFFFYKMAAGGRFGSPKITFDHISHHFRSIRHFFYKILSTKWPLVAILDDRKLLLIAFLAISD